MIQLLLVTFSCVAIWMIARKDSWYKWGYLVGLVGQPLWLYDTYVHEQGGMFVVSIWFTWVYAEGVYNHIIKGK